MSNFKIAPLIVGVLALFLIFLLVSGNSPFNRIGEVNQFVYGIYSDDSYKLLGSSTDKVFNKTFAIYDEQGNELKGFVLLAFLKTNDTFGKLGIDQVHYSYYVIKNTGSYNKMVYQSPWVVEGQFTRDPEFSSSPPDVGLMAMGKVVKYPEGQLYFYKQTANSVDTVMPLSDLKTPTRPYPISYGGKSGNGVLFCMDTPDSERSYSCQIGLPNDYSLQTYNVQLNVLLKETSLLGLQSGTLNPNNSEFTTTMKLKRKNYDGKPSVDFQIIWANPYIYK